MTTNRLNGQFKDYLLTTYTDPNLTCLIFGFLKHANILPGHPDRDDLIQECHLALAQALQKYDQQSSQPKISRNAYAYQRLRWCLSKYFERNSRDHHHCSLQLDAPSSEADLTTPTLSYEINFDEREQAKVVVQHLLQNASGTQARLIKLLLTDPGLTNQELAVQLHISPQALSYHRKQLRRLALQFSK